MTIKVEKEYVNLNQAVSHDRKDETPEGKARWFQSWSQTERAELLCQFTGMILFVNPKVAEQKDAQPVVGRILVLSKA